MPTDADLVAILPVKPWSQAKSRLAVDLGQTRASSLARAFTFDTVAATVQCSHVDQTVVVSRDPQVRDLAQQVGAKWCDDSPDLGINAALEFAMAKFPANVHLLLTCDLPSVRASDLTALRQEAMPHPAAFVADHGGLGSTALVLRSDSEVAPQFGARSRARHRTSGATEIMTGPSGVRLRTDVDTVVDLTVAAGLGLGPATSAAWLTG